ncbi:MAG TPA: hypothetical protein VMF89_30495 [Polyangiales bacterium]|nr:hypothetical protein [Polyangiales bacterium]
MQLRHFVLSAVLFAGSTGLALSEARAEDKAVCSVKTTRAACPGKEAESFKKCDGKASCDKTVEAKSAAACAEAATAACANDRLDVTKSKTITATWNGQPLKSKSGKEDLCLDYAKRAAEFDKCPAK